MKHEGTYAESRGEGVTLMKLGLLILGVVITFVCVFAAQCFAPALIKLASQEAQQV